MQVDALCGAGFVDRLVAGLVVFSLAAVFLLSSQSAASFSTYLLAVLVLVGGGRWRELAPNGRMPALLRVFLVFLVYFCVSVWWSADVVPRAVFSVYSRSLLIATFVIALATSLHRVPGFGLWTARALAVSGALAALAALIDMRVHPTWHGRLLGLGQLHNAVVAALAFNASLLCALQVAMESRTLWRRAGVVCVVVVAAAVFETGSRGGYLSALLGASVLIALSRPLSPVQRRWWLGMGLLGLLAAGAVSLARPDWQLVLFPRGDSFRAEIWSLEWQRLRDDGPWFGLGILTPDAVTVGDLRFSHPHNLYLASALQGGIVGLLLLLTVLAGSARRLLLSRQQPEARLALALLTAGMSAYAFDGWELIDKVGLSWLLIWVPVATALAAEVRAQMRNA